MLFHIFLRYLPYKNNFQSGYKEIISFISNCCLKNRLEFVSNFYNFVLASSTDL